MPVHKRKYESGRTSWYFKFQQAGATRGTSTIRGFGFVTKREAEDAERKRRAEEEQKHELAKMGSSVTGPLPQTLSMLLQEFFRQHVDKKLAPKTIERYHEQAALLGAELLRMPITEITPLHLSREWNRLLASGGHHRYTKEPRPLSAKTVRNMAGVLSSAFARAAKWGLITNNPVSRSEPPVPRKRRGIPDNDAPGRKRVVNIARALLGKVARLIVLELEGGAKDVSEWFDRGHSELELIALLDGDEVSR